MPEVHADDPVSHPPIAAIRPTVLENHGVRRVDNYYWLRERENQQVIAYLNAENEYSDAMLAHLQPLEEKIFDEIVARIEPDDASVPYIDRGFQYYTRYEKGQQYPLYCRKPVLEKEAGGDDNLGDEQIILDVNSIAAGQAYCSVAGVRVSPDGRRLAFGVDFNGRRRYTLRFKDLATGQMLADEVADVAGSCVWAADNETVFFSRKDPQTLRSYLIVRHKLGMPTDQDVAVFEETDEEFACSVRQSRSREYLLISSSQTLSTETRYLKADDPEGDFKVFWPREENHEYSIDHLGDRFVIRSNFEAKNFQLWTATIDDHAKSNWKSWIPHRDDVLLQRATLFDEFAVISEKVNALTKLRIVSYPDPAVDSLVVARELPFSEAAYVASVNATPDPSTTRVRYSYTSLTTPGSVLEYDVATDQTELLKQTPVLGDFDSRNYITRRLWATARDGTKVPVSLVHHVDTPIDGTAPCLQYGYGSYGASMEPRFSIANLSLLDRGFVYAIAHIRGGQEMGRAWYEDGKLLHKINTFTDFIDVGKFLIAEKYASPQKLYARGGSAGGLLMGAVINMTPDQYSGVIADVPFVDVVTTMLDESIPLTTFEYDEWGNPNEKTFFDYMLSYSPYDQVAAVAYPPLLVTTGLNDSQVQYWEPAKWVAKIRATQTGTNPVLLKTNMDAGHGGASGRFEPYKLVATRFAFLLDLASQDSQ